MKQIILGIVIALTSCASWAQGVNNCGSGATPVCNYESSTSISGTALKLASNGGLTPMFVYSWSGSPTVVTTTIKGCTSSGITPDTCDALDSYSGSTAINRTPDLFSVKAPTGAYNYFLVTSTWTGSSTFTVYERISTAGGKGATFPPPGSAGLCWVSTSGTAYGWGACSGTSSTAWANLTSGTNITGAFLIGTGASLGVTGGGTIAATSYVGYTPAAGKVLGGATPSAVTITSAYVDSSIGLTANPLSQFASTTSAQLAGVLSNESGTGLVVFNNGPTLIAPVLGTPASGVLTNLTGLPLTTGVTGILPIANGGTATATPGLVAGTNVTITGSWPNQTINSSGGGGSGTVTNIATTSPITGGPITTTGTIACATCGVTGSGLNQFASTTSSQLAGVISDETGSGALVFGTSPTLVTPTLGTPASGNLANTTGYPKATSGAFGIVEPDNSTITISAGVISAVGGGSGNTTSTSLTTNTVPKANGANSIINSSISDNGATVSTTENASFGSSGSTASIGFVTTSGSNSLTTQAAATGTTWTLPSTTGTFADSASSPLSLSATTGVLTCTTCGVTGSGLNQFAATTSAQLAGVISDETGTGALVFGTSPTLVTPALGTPASGVATNLTGLPLTSGVTGILPPANGGNGVANTATDTLGTSNQNWATLGTGIVKNTVTTGAISDAASSDVIGLWSGTCNSSSFLRGDGACSSPAGSGTVTSSGSPVSGNVAAFSTSTNIIPATAANIVGLFSTCSGTQYLGADGSCHTASGSGTVTSIATTSPIGGGTITSTGTITCTTCVVASSPGVGLAHFAGSTQTVTSSAVIGADMTNNTVTATQLAAQYSKGSCTEAWAGSGTSFALTSGDDAASNNTCYNDSGVTRTITAVKCRNDNASNTTTVNPTFGSAGTGTTICSGALTCGNSYAYSSTCTVSNASWTTGTGIDPAMGGTLTGTSVAVIVEYTY